MRYCRRFGFYIWLICLFSVLTTGCTQTTTTKTQQQHPDSSQPHTAQQESQLSQNKTPGSNSSSKTFFDTAKADFSNWPVRVIDDSKDTFLTKENIIALLLAGGASIVMNQDADNEIADHFDKNRRLSNFEDESLNVIGHPGTHFAMTGLWYILSVEDNDEINHQRALTMASALSIDWALIMGLKLIRYNETPNGKNLAWPSGHTSSSFTVASVLDEYYGPKVGIPAYAAASLVAYRMMDTGDHWASDVVFGATLGWIVGHSVAGKHKNLEIGGFKVSPFMANTGSPAMGISLLKRF